MTVKECYDKIGNYEEVVSRLMNDTIVKKFALKFLNDPSYDRLCQAVENEDYPEAFRQAHTLKGVTNNLALTPLCNISSEVTELLRDEQPHDVSDLMAQLKETYQETIENIKQL